MDSEKHQRFSCPVTLKCCFGGQHWFGVPGGNPSSNPSLLFCPSLSRFINPKWVKSKKKKKKESWLVMLGVSVALLGNMLASTALCCDAKAFSQQEDIPPGPLLIIKADNQGPKNRSYRSQITWDGHFSSHHFAFPNKLKINVPWRAARLSQQIRPLKLRCYTERQVINS